MSDSEDTGSHSGQSDSSFKQDRMSVSELEQDISREDEMPSVDDVSEDDDSAGSSTSETQAYGGPGNNSRDSGSNDVAGAAALVSTPAEADMKIMTASYTEIESRERGSRDDSDGDNSSLKKLLTEGLVEQEGDMIHFVAQDLENKIRFSSPESPVASRYLCTVSQDSPLEPTLLCNIEKEAKKIASSVDELTEHLAVSLHTISAISVESVSLYRDAVCKTCDSVDSNIKAMYQLMAKCEELSKATAPVYKIAEQVREIKKLLDIFENVMS